jgi:hypothetical protein
MSVLIYRELDAANIPPHVAEWLEVRGQLVYVLDKKGNEHAIVENDLPRDPEISEAIIGGPVYGPGLTIGFGVYDDEGNRIGMYNSVAKAEAAAEQARVVTLDSDDDMEWDSVSGDAE